MPTVRLHEGCTLQVLGRGVKDGDEFTLRVKAYKMLDGTIVLHPVGDFPTRGKGMVVDLQPTKS